MLETIAGERQFLDRGNLETFLPCSLIGGKIENIGGWFSQGVFNIIAENLRRWPMNLGQVGGTKAPIAMVAIKYLLEYRLAYLPWEVPQSPKLSTELGIQLARIGEPSPSLPSLIDSTFEKALKNIVLIGWQSDSKHELHALAFLKSVCLSTTRSRARKHIWLGHGSRNDDSRR